MTIDTNGLALGDLVKSTINGFTGRIVGFGVWLDDAPSALVEETVSPNKDACKSWITIKRLEKVTK